jgi:hypothetical protein
VIFAKNLRVLNEVGTTSKDVLCLVARVQILGADEKCKITDRVSFLASAFNARIG